MSGRGIFRSFELRHWASYDESISREMRKTRDRLHRFREAVHGAVTGGSNWRFLKLAGGALSIDAKEFFLDDLARRSGIPVRISRG